MKRLSKSTKMRGAIFAFLLAFAVSVSAQVQVQGTVVDERGDALIGATVQVQGTAQGTTTDVNGRFTISAPAGGTLIVSFIGYEAQHVPVSANVHVRLLPDGEMLQELIVVAYGLSTRYAITGAVSTISRDDIAMRPITNVATALEGMGPGVQVRSSFGEPGAAPTIRVRGFSSMLTGANDPLIVLDGVTFSGSLSNINPDDIESISVLKDAASAALFGSRAANGVILITTRRGRQGRSQLNVSVRHGITQRAMREYDRLNPHEFMQASWYGVRNSHMFGGTGMSLEAANAQANATIMSHVRYNIFNVPNDQLFDANGLFNPDAQILSSVVGDLDWWDAIGRTGHRQEYTISGTTATENFNMFFSLGYLNETGFVVNSDFERISGRIGAELTPRTWLTTGLSVSTSFDQRNRNDVSGSAAFINIFNMTRAMAPIFPVHLHDLTTHADGSRPGGFILDAAGNRQFDRGEARPGVLSRQQSLNRHAIWERQLNTDLTRTNRLSVDPFVRINFLNDFSLLVRGNLTHRSSLLERFDNPIIGDGAGAGGRAVRDLYQWREGTFAQMLTWGRNFNQVHNVDILVGHEYYEWNRKRVYAMGTGQSLPGNQDLSNFATMSQQFGYSDAYRLQSVLSRVRYNFDERYFVDFSLRRDGSSMFHPNYRWGNFWSAGASWVISREDFMRDVHWVNTLRARASYGQVGNDTFGHGRFYLFTDTYSITQNAARGAVFRNMTADPTVTWESLANLTAGFEGRLFNRLNFVIDYFDKQNIDLLFDVSLPLSAGNSNPLGTSQPSIRQNAGTISNRGVEISLDADIIRTRDWTWNLGGDVTFLRNRIVRLPEEMQDGHITGHHRWLEGVSRFEFYVRQWAGVDQMTGLNLYYLDEDLRAGTPAARIINIDGVYYTTQMDRGLRAFSGSAVPDAFGAIRSHVGFRNFSLFTIFTYSIGGRMLDVNYSDMMTFGTQVSSLHADAARAWNGVPEGMTENSPNRIDRNGVPRLDNTVGWNHTNSSTRFLTDASNFAIKNISLGYNFPTEIANRLDLSGLSMSVNAENLAIFTRRRGMDPNQANVDTGVNSNHFVPMRTISMSLNITL